MKVRVDFSIFTASGEAVGHIEGELDCVVGPMIGDTISFMFAPNGCGIPSGHEFGGQLKVTDRIISPNRDGPITLMLDDLIVGTKPQAMMLVAYFEDGFGLFANLYEQPV